MKLKRIDINPFASGASLQLWLCMLLTFLWFDLCWSLESTMTTFSIPETWVNALLLTFILTLPQLLGGMRRTQAALTLLAAVWCECNLMYYRTYFTAIPVGSYLLVGNLSDFKESVIDSLRLADIGFFVPVIWAFVTAFGRRKEKATSTRQSRRAASWWTLAIAVISFALLAPHKFSLTRAWSDMGYAAYRHSCRVPMYTIAGSLLNDVLTTYTPATAAQLAEVDRWMSEQKELPVPIDSMRRDNVVVVLLESFETWPIGLKVQGKEITPHINRLVADTTTLYVPHVVSQVGAGRSIDAQLLINAGMLPRLIGLYAMDNVANEYHTLAKDIKAERRGRSYIITGDKSSTWNQEAVGQAFGIDTMLARSAWRAEERMGGRRQVGDRALFRQVIEKMQAGEIWPDGENAFIQMVSYSGHNPFRLPAELDELHLDPSALPETVYNYLTTAHYTDQAVGLLVDYLKTRPDFDRTIVVKTGDHEGLAAQRRDLAEACDFVSPHQEVPLIVVNSPEGGRIDKVVGQVDIHPTLLQLMGLHGGGWRGMGRSALDAGHPGVAIGSQGDVCGDTAGVDAATMRHLCEARAVSDILICYDLLSRIATGDAAQP